MKIHTVILGLLLVIFLSACASASKKAKSIKVGGVNKSSVLEAVKQPAYSANLIRKKVPESLSKLEKSYEVPNNCYSALKELSELDSALGPDLIDKAISKNNAFAVNVGQMLSKEVESSIPFNSVIKRLSGARKHEKAMLSAKVKGNARRSYLKGWLDAKGCSPHQLKINKHTKKITKLGVKDE